MTAENNIILKSLKKEVEELQNKINDSTDFLLPDFIYGWSKRIGELKKRIEYIEDND